ncbi:MAG: SRPBCC domain-containing protein [Cocleimonas sp.]
MKQITTEIEISAPPEKVWKILNDFDHWAQWNTTVTKASGGSTINSQLNITMSDENGKDSNAYSPVIIQTEAPKLLHWRAKMMAHFLFSNDKIIELEATSTGTKMTHREKFSGLMVKAFWGKMKEGVPPILNSMNRDLKTAAEKN